MHLLTHPPRQMLTAPPHRRSCNGCDSRPRPPTPCYLLKQRGHRKPATSRWSWADHGRVRPTRKTHTI
eukprot:9191256-Pyramimonas_sp.AAC.1